MLEKIDSILFPTDGSEAAKKASESCFNFVKNVDAELHVIYVIEGLYPSKIGESTGRKLKKIHKEEGQKEINELKEKAKERDIKCESAILEGIPDIQITNYAQEKDVDLILMSTHGRGGAKRLLLGSVTEKVVRTSDKPVLTIRPS
ncbi:MAG: Nucleotide-binding protein UspA family [Candidatus Methanohalarchaeum thermophilum]|uniref:Nucleotide-binding protein UspA family n=1 Tax=Methanohalarchaeum thermophilum TaxID=1903181 RepID=A0A1Q6DU19_METT1|nr:MAG: Nucleotide-binding protein UspA family [Candidatus Methanohalarchaeum thermophilum]